MAGSSQDNCSYTACPDYGHLGVAFVCYKGYYLPSYFQEDKIMDRELEDFDLTKDDVLVVGFPKSGTSQMIWLLREMYADWDLVNVLNRNVVPMLEWCVNQQHTEGTSGIAKKTFLEDPCLSGSGRRLIKSHLPYDMLPRTARSGDSCKIIYVTRNPKDVCANFYYLERSYLPMTSPDVVMTWEEFVTNFVEGRVVYGPWMNVVMEWWQHRADENILHVTYEDLITNPTDVIKMVAEFLGRPLTDKVIKTIAAFTTSEEKVIKVGGVQFKKGVTGEWKNHFTKEQSDLYDRTIGVGLAYKGLDFLYEPVGNKLAFDYNVTNRFGFTFTINTPSTSM
ncbi:sulfotransferase 1B1-like [Saccoglossus kowalevskii]|uniref:Sulfotransferase family cytosolic 1B member 1-like n=1 Tax=Saccoglossus kowalevskii TaxID=10224 RepID=A0ABM0GVE5_SACKO|nr:PREDICTED: sulfotransferase family cytosolic 1B member 1-like [Saccoglossus kowalevskii]